MRAALPDYASAPSGLHRASELRARSRCPFARWRVWYILRKSPLHRDCRNLRSSQRAGRRWRHRQARRQDQLLFSVSP